MVFVSLVRSSGAACGARSQRLRRGWRHGGTAPNPPISQVQPSNLPRHKQPPPRIDRHPLSLSLSLSLFPSRSLNPRPHPPTIEKHHLPTTKDARRAAPCGHFASLVRSTFGLRGYPPIFDLRRINQAASVSHIPLAVRRARRAGYRGCVSRKRRGRTWRRTQVANATREKRPF